MQSEYVKKLEAFAKQAGGDFNHSSQPTTSLNSKGWSKVEIRIPHRGTDLYYIAFSGPNSAEVHSGFYAAGKLPLKLFCRTSMVCAIRSTGGSGQRLRQYSSNESAS